MKKEKTYTYDQIAFPILFVSVVMLFLASTWNMENQIDNLKLELQHTTDSLTTVIDSLILEIDTLEWKNQIWDFNISNNTTHLLSALMMVESSNNDSAYNAREDAVGCLQIRKTMVNDVNRILRRQGKDYRFTYDDRWLRNKSIQMFDIYCKHYGLTTAEEIARCWNGGPRGMDKDATVYYWNKVQDHLDS